MSHYGRATVGRLQILVPGGDVLAADGECEFIAGGDDRPHRVRCNGEELPLLVADEDLRLRAAVSGPPAHWLCLNGGASGFALACDDIGSVAGEELVFHDLPACMTGAAQPVARLAVSGSTVFCVTSGPALARNAVA